MRLNPIIRTALMGASLGALLLAEDPVHLSPRFQTVYVVEMEHGLDQYLTGRLPSSRVLWVVLEPSSADAVLTDSVDDTFWNWLTLAYPPSGTAGSTSNASADRSGTIRRDVQATGRYRGTIFLVDPRKR